MSRFLETTHAFEKYQKTTSLFKKISKNQLKTSPKIIRFFFVQSFFQQKKREMTSSLLPFLSS
ncbi:LexA family transcriptional regulator [Streptococcus sp. FDAARGOS_256]|nr:LexA family transcriptional regulator [Streptococcus oralis subsp. oralis]PNK70956.1 LexA family transcriptional regulator [Streptococcus sp. FDAARGOS_256]